MAVTALATTSDVESALGRSLTASETTIAEHALDKASELFRRESGQTFTASSSTVRLKVNASRVYLVQHPVTAITSVVDDDGDAVTYEQTGQWLAVSRNSSTYVTVTYTHGGDVPDLVRLAVAEIAARNVNLDDEARAGKTQSATTAGPYTDSGTFAAWAVGGQVMLSPEDKTLARSYRPMVPRVRISASPTTASNTWRTTSATDRTADGEPWRW